MHNRSEGPQETEPYQHYLCNATSQVVSEEQQITAVWKYSSALLSQRLYDKYSNDISGLSSSRSKELWISFSINSSL